MSIIQCKCNHSMQDKIHGKSRRVFNKTRKEENFKPVYRCTVCNSERTK